MQEAPIDRLKTLKMKELLRSLEEPGPTGGLGRHELGSDVDSGEELGVTVGPGCKERWG